MARVCDLCGKSVARGNMVSHSHRKARRSWSPNVHRVRAVVKGRVKRLSVCTRCLRSGKVQRAAGS